MGMKLDEIERRAELGEFNDLAAEHAELLLRLSTVTAVLSARNDESVLWWFACLRSIINGATVKIDQPTIQ